MWGGIGWKAKAQRITSLKTTAMGEREREGPTMVGWVKAWALSNCDPMDWQFESAMWLVDLF